ncbi:hypothetical protein GE09DRAFT_964139 [Coniochaeta sp. 2T2.1]|nr:hypothetical protein GE09DRAFT_964139 [Coniochaeta sp. 2T2.1]
MASAPPIQPTPRPPKRPRLQQQDNNYPIHSQSPAQPQQQQQTQPQLPPKPPVPIQHVPPSNAHLDVYKPATGPRPGVLPSPRQNVLPSPRQNVLPSPAPSDEPSPAVSTSHESPHTAPASLPDLPPMNNQSSSARDVPHWPHPVTEARFVVGSALEDSSRAGGQSAAGTPQPATSRADHPQLMFMFPSMLIGSSRPAQPPTPNPEPAANRQRPNDGSGRPPQVDIAAQAGLIDTYMASQGGPDAFTKDAEQPRFQLLSRACAHGDTHFVALHQLHCMWSRRREDVYAILGNDHKVIDPGFLVVELVLKSNDLIHPRHKDWMADFPHRLSLILQAYQGHRQCSKYVEAVHDAVVFLARAAVSYGSLAMAMESRGYPYLVDELLGQLGCRSITLQHALFTASRRRLLVADGHFGRILDQAFFQDQRQHQDQSGAFLHMDPIPDPRELERRNSRLIDHYKTIVQEALRSRQEEQRRRSQISPAVSSPLPQQRSFTPRPILTSNTQVRQPSISGNQPNFAASSPAAASPHLPPTSIPSHITPNPASFPANQPFAPPFSPPQAGRQVMPQNQAQYNALMEQQQQQQLIATFENQQLMNGNQQAFSNPAMNHQYPPQQTMYQQQAQPQQSQLPQQQNVAQLQTQYQQPQLAATHRFMGQNLQAPSQTLQHSHGARQPSSQLQQQQRQQMAQGAGYPRFIPPPNHPIPLCDFPTGPEDRKSIMMSLHQAEVRSPRRKVLAPATGGEGDERYYQAVMSLAVPPARIPPAKVLHKFYFEVSDEELSRASQFIAQSANLPVVTHFNGSLRWRVRTTKLKPKKKFDDVHEWSCADMDWPPHITLNLNGNNIQIRRKPHNGRDQPAELTPFVTQGRNELLVAVAVTKDPPADQFALAVEIVETRSHASIMDYIWTHSVIPEEDTLNKIKRRVTGPQQDDDSISVVQPEALSIDVADPFTRAMWQIPVRGAACTHMECFDLSIWLETRPSRTVRCPHSSFTKCGCNDQREPSVVDKWKCPICEGDARPYSLKIDGFLLKVRQELERAGKIKAKRIQAAPDGMWRAEVEEDSDDDDDDSDGDGPRQKLASKGPAVPKKPVEVIDLLDD